MTLVATSPGSLDPEPGRWDYDLDMLGAAGVAIDQQQAWLLDPERASDVDVLVAYALPDPLTNLDGYRTVHELARLYVRDDDGNRGPVVIPVTGRVDWALDGLGDMRAFHEPAWTRFPSVPVRIVIPDRFDETDVIARPVRVWDLWPLDGDQAWQAHNLAEQIWTDSWYTDVQNFAAWKNNQITSCDLAHCNVNLVGGSGHAPDECAVGAQEALELADRLFHNGAVGWYRPPNPPLSMLTADVVDGLVRRLATSGLRNHQAVFDAVPLWERERLLDAEKEYCPWV